LLPENLDISPGKHDRGNARDIRNTTRRVTLRIGIVAPPWIPIPTPAYGGIEQVVALQAQGLAGLGHEVTLFAPQGSALPGVQVVQSTLPVPSRIGEAGAEAARLRPILRELDKVDVVVDHSSPAGLALVATAAPPVLHVVHGPIDRACAKTYRATLLWSRDVHLVAISDAQRRGAPSLPFLGVCHNGIDVTAAPFRSSSEGYLAFLGRMSPEKDPAAAIAIANAAGKRLLIAAKCREPEERAYFDAVVRPHLGENVVWLGELGSAEKYQLLAGADALVFPIAWPEPFGLVMAEAMATGTPVLATPRGAAPEVVRDGYTGFLRPRASDLSHLVDRLDQISRANCRKWVVDHFSAAAMALRYERLLHRTVSSTQLHPGVAAATNIGA
jgi:glycosyltransferase involved in cell wall biosynthesis